QCSRADRPPVSINAISVMAESSVLGSASRNVIGFSEKPLLRSRYPEKSKITAWSKELMCREPFFWEVIVAVCVASYGRDQSARSLASRSSAKRSAAESLYIIRL